MRTAFARVGAARRLVASRLFRLAKINGRLKELRPLSQSRLLSGPNTHHSRLWPYLFQWPTVRVFAAVRGARPRVMEFVRLVLAMPRLGRPGTEEGGPSSHGFFI